jgi:hypothetical protein
MKFLVMAAVVLFAGLGPVSAQGTLGGAGSGSTIGTSSLNSQGSLNNSSSINDTRSSTSVTLGSDPRASSSVAGKNPGEFVPSTFQNYSVALDMGEEALRAQPTTLAEAARLAQHARAVGTKPPIALDQDAHGKLIVVQANH